MQMDKIVPKNPFMLIIASSCLVSLVNVIFAKLCPKDAKGEESKWCGYTTSFINVAICSGAIYLLVRGYQRKN
jgi:hypothetical protein